MLDRPRSARSTRTVMTRLAVGGAAGIATLLSAAPGAMAASADDVAPEASTEPSTRPAPSDPAPSDPAPSTDVTQKAPQRAVVADFGTQKFRVGVQIADGSWVPAGTTTAGSTFTITETGPNVDDDDASDAVTTRTITCTTAPSGQDDVAPTTTFCDDGDGGPPSRDRSARRSAAAAAAAATGGVTVDPTTPSAPPEQVYTAQPGSTVTVRQTSAAANLVATPEVATIAPCDASVNGYCSGSFLGVSRLSTVLFTNVGLPPVAVDDVRRTEMDTPISIDVLTNDDTVNGAPLTGLKTVTAPAHGTAEVDGDVSPTPTPTPTESVSAAAVGPGITYTPAAGFTGTDRFTYSLSTPNGTATATVTVTVRGDDDGDDDGTGTDDGAGGSGDESGDESGDGALPSVGGVDVRVLGYGVALIAGGGALTVAARQRRTSRGAHARIG